MWNIDKKIIKLFKIIYDIDENDVLQLEEILNKIDNKNKDKIVGYLYIKYQFFKENNKILIQNLKFIENDIEQQKDKIQANKLLLNI